jgi:hypothetical protein
MVYNTIFWYVYTLWNDSSTPLAQTIHAWPTSQFYQLISWWTQVDFYRLAVMSNAAMNMGVYSLYT